MTIRNTYILPPGTYNNYSTQFDSDVVLSGVYTFNGNTGIYTTTGNIDTRYANVTVNVTNGGGSNTYLMLAANTGYIDVGNVVATGVDVYLWAKGAAGVTPGVNYEETTVFVSSVRTANEYNTPNVTATRVWLYSVGVPTSWNSVNADRRPVAVSATKLTYANPLGGSVVSDSGSGPYSSYYTSIRGTIYRTLFAKLTGATVQSETISTWDEFSEITAKVPPTQTISPTSVPMSRINKELGYAAPFNQTLDLNNTALRRLLRKTTSGSSISLSDARLKTTGYLLTPASFNLTPDVIALGYSNPYGALSTPKNLFSPDISAVYTSSINSGASADYVKVIFSFDQTNTYMGYYYIIDVATGKQITLFQQGDGYSWQSGYSYDGTTCTFMDTWTSGVSTLIRLVRV